MWRALLAFVVGLVLFALLGLGLLWAVAAYWPSTTIKEFSTLLPTTTSALGAIITTMWEIFRQKPSDPAIDKPGDKAAAEEKRQQAQDSATFNQLTALTAQNFELQKEVDGLRNACQTLHGRNKDLKQFGRRILATRLGYFVAVAFSVCHLASGSSQGLIQHWWPLDEAHGVARFCIYFSQSLLLAACAIVVPAGAYLYFLRKASSFDHWHLIKIGFLGLFFSGVISLFSLSPEMIALIIHGKPQVDSPQVAALKPLDYIPVSYFLFLVACRGVVFPTLGLASCLAVAVAQQPRK